MLKWRTEELTSKKGWKKTLFSKNLKDLDLNSEQKAALHAVNVQKRSNLCHTYEAEVQNQNVQI